MNDKAEIQHKIRVLHKKFKSGFALLDMHSKIKKQPKSSLPQGFSTQGQRRIQNPKQKRLVRDEQKSVFYLLFEYTTLSLHV